MRILDRILMNEEMERIVGTPRPAGGAFAAAEHVQIDNVAEYVFRDVKVGDSWTLSEDFPTIAPPWELAWYEYRRPSVIQSLAKFTPSMPDETPGMPDHVGVLVEGVPTDDGFVSRYYIYAATGKDVVRGPIVFQIDCDKEGRVTPEGIRVILDPSVPVTDAERRRLKMWLGGSDLLVPVLMATSLLHSKNVTIEREPPVDAGLQRSHRKRYGTERVRFHLLHIEPMRRVLRSAGAESDAPGEGVKVAMHIRRGYFGDYRDGRGLFGRWHGIFWWDQTVRGRADSGLVQKEYVVHAPRGR